jgi:hypothetical protein
MIECLSVPILTLGLLGCVPPAAQPRSQTGVPLPEPRPVDAPALWHRGQTLPPVDFDHEYAGILYEVRELDQETLRAICRPATPPFRTKILGCSVRGDGECTIYLAEPLGHSMEITRRHEIGHCNGWRADHQGARAAPPPVPVLSPPPMVTASPPPISEPAYKELLEKQEREFLERLRLGGEERRRQ